MTVEAIADGRWRARECSPEPVEAISRKFAGTLASLRGRFLDLREVPVHETMALVLRSSHTARSAVRSRRMTVLGMVRRS